MSQTQPITIKIPSGPIQGYLADGLAHFRGIPYAAAPVGELRFAAPQPLQPWSEPLVATQYGPISLQDIDPLPMALPGTENNFYAPQIKTSEDCLSLNIITPDAAGSAPVLVWIHGGAFLCGSGTGSWTNGVKFARDHGIVVVTINYRLGISGGLYLAPGQANFGLLDQIESLRWVQGNIAAFGGDPARVTIAGQSAGGMSVASLLVSPLSKGLFARAIVESGHVSVTTAPADAAKLTTQIAGQLGLDATADDFMQKLRGLSTLRIAAVQRANGISRPTFPSVTDGVSLPDNPLEYLATGAKNGVELMIGTTSEENRLFNFTGWSSDSSVPLERYLRGYVAEDDLAEAAALYQGIPATDAMELIATEHDWTQPCRELALTYANAGNRVFHYEFAWKSHVAGLGAAHLVDLPVWWNNLDAPGVDELLGTGIATDPEAVLVARGASSAWANFISTGDPASAELGEWPAFNSETMLTKVVDTQSEVIGHRLADRLDFWRDHSATGPMQAMIEGAAQ
jgi:para-nitrobenzyl esterase